NSLWWTLGVISRGLDPALVYQLARAVLVVAFVAVLWWFLGLLLEDRLQRRACLIITVFGGGFATVFSLLNLSWDGGAPAGTSALNVLELLTWPSLAVYPHFIAALVLLLGMVGLTVKAFAATRNAYRYACGAGLLGALVASFHLFDVATAVAVVGGYALLSKRAGCAPRGLPGLLAMILLPGVIVGAAVAHGISASPVGRLWSASNVMPSPSPFAVAVALGVPLLLALSDHRRLLHWHEKNLRSLLAPAWFLANVLVVYTDTVIPFERRLLMGLQIPVAILAVQAWGESVIPAWQRWRARSGDSSRLPSAVAWGLLVLLVLPQTISTGMVLAGRGGNHEECLSEDLLQLCGRLSTAPAGAVLCEGAIGNWLPRLTGRAVYVGHSFLTPHYAERLEQMRAFFAPATRDVERIALLRQAGCALLLAKRSQRPALQGLLRAQVLTPLLGSVDYEVYRIN
ncbi:MAG: hypothetical protein WCP21_19015, partial [Armatimonadota bacterium]